MTSKKQVCIVGGGIGGLAAGALLSQQGHSVMVYEREQLLGGRSLSFDPTEMTVEEYLGLLSRFDMAMVDATPSVKTLFAEDALNGFALDLGFHVVGGAQKSIPNRILNDLGNPTPFVGSRVGRIHDEGYDFPFLSAGDKIRMLPRILQLILSQESKMRELDEVSMHDMIQRYGKGKMRMTLEYFSRIITTVNDLQCISTGEAFRSQLNLLQGSHPVGYPKQGLQRLSEQFAEVLSTHGGVIHTGVEVEEIVVDDNHASAVMVEGERHDCDMVVSNVPVQDVFSLVDETVFPSPYVQRLRDLEGTGSVCAYYSFDRDDIAEELIGKSFLFLEPHTGLSGGAAAGMIDFMTAHPDVGMSPQDKVIVQSYVICTPEEARQRKTQKELCGVLDKWLDQLLPDFEQQMEWALYPVTWHLDGVAKMIQQDKPTIQTPVDGLYFVGDGVKAGGIGINCAAASAQQLMDVF